MRTGFGVPATWRLASGATLLNVPRRAPPPEETACRRRQLNRKYVSRQLRRICPPPLFARIATYPLISEKKLQRLPPSVRGNFLPGRIISPSVLHYFHHLSYILTRSELLPPSVLHYFPHPLGEERQASDDIGAIYSEAACQSKRSQAKPGVGFSSSSSALYRRNHSSWWKS